jgi:hypothetical protein
MSKQGWLVAGLFTIALLDAVPAAAQRRLYIIPDARSLGVNVGPSVNSDINDGRRGLEWSVTYEAPLIPGTRARLEVGRSLWSVHQYREVAIEPARTAKRTRATVSLIRLPAPPVEGFRVGLYTGGGFGAYRDDDPTRAVTDRARLGVHGLGGMEYISTEGTMSFVTELRLDAVRRASSPTLTLSATIGIRRRF